MGRGVEGTHGAAPCMEDSCGGVVRGISGPKHVSRLIITFVCVTVTPSFLLVSITSRMQRYEIVNARLCSH
jgi:hypothetical protein